MVDGFDQRIWKIIFPTCYNSDFFYHFKPPLIELIVGDWLWRDTAISGSPSPAATTPTPIPILSSLFPAGQTRFIFSLRHYSITPLLRIQLTSAFNKNEDNCSLI